MNPNKKFGNCWILCPSRRFPGKYYYFNLSSKESVWFDEIDKTQQHGSGPVFKTAEKNHSYPEPRSPLQESPNTTISSNAGPNFRVPDSTDMRMYKNMVNVPSMPTFGQAVFPKSMPEPQYPPCLMWMPVPMSSFMMPDVNRSVTVQTVQPDREIYVQSCAKPLSQYWANDKPMVCHRDNKVNPYIIREIPANSWTMLKKFKDASTEIDKVDDNPFIAYTNKSVTQKQVEEPKFKVICTQTDTETGLEMETLKTKFERKASEADVNMSPKRDPSGADKFNQKAIISSCLNIRVDNSLNSEDLGVREQRELDRQDLRLYLNAKKAKSNSLEDLASKVENSSKSARDIVPKKKVTFDLSNLDRLSSIGSVDVTLHSHVTIEYLYSIAKGHPNADRWYIVVDLDVLLEDYGYINDFVQKDPKCKLLIPQAVLVDAEAAARGAARPIPARTLCRKLATLPPHFEVQQFYIDAAGRSADTADAILKCCIDTTNDGFHVVLIVNDKIVYRRAKHANLHCYQLRELKHGATNVTNKFDDIKNIKIQVPNVNDIEFASRYDGLPIHCNRKKLFYVNDTHMKSFDTEKSYNDINYNENINDINMYQNDIDDYLKFRNSLSDRKNKQSSFLNNTPLLQHKIDKSIADERTMYQSLNYSPNSQELDQRFAKTNFNMRDEGPFITNSDPQNIVIGCPMEEELKMYCIKNKMVENRLKIDIEQRLCSFRQIMEDSLSDILQSLPSSSNTKPPWSFLEVLQCMRTLYEDHTTVQFTIDRICDLLINDKDCNLRYDVAPNDYMKALGCGIMLMQYLQSVLPTPNDAAEAEIDLCTLYQNISEGGLESMEDVGAPVATRRDDVDVPRRLNFVKDRQDIIDYLKRHYQDWRSYDTTEFTNGPKNQRFQVLRTNGKNLNSLTLNTTKCMVLDTSKNDQQNLSLKEDDKEVSSKIPFKVINQKQVLDKDFHDKESKEPSNKLQLEPTDNALDNNDVPVSKQSTFCAYKNAGLKVIKNTQVLAAFENRMNTKTELDLDALDYSEIRDSSNCSKESVYNEDDIYDKVKENKDLAANDNANHIDSVQPTINRPTEDYDKLENPVHDIDIKHDEINEDNLRLEIDMNISVQSINDIFNTNEAPILLNDVMVSINDDFVPFNDIFETTNDSGLGDESVHAYTLVKSFLIELSALFKIVYKFIDDSIEQCSNDKPQQERSERRDKAAEIQRHVTAVIDNLKSIILRESQEEVTLKTLLVRGGLELASDRRMLRYRQVVTKCLEQAQMLRNCLIMVAALLDDSDSVSGIESIHSSMRFLNIFN